MPADFKTLDNIFHAFTSADLTGKQLPSLGGSLSKVRNVNIALLEVLENNGRGVLTANDVIKQFEELKSKSEDKEGFSKFLTMFTLDTVVDLGKHSEKDGTSVSLDDGKHIKVSGLREVIGKNFVSEATKLQASMFLCRSPFFNPAVRNCKTAEIFLNSMPSTVLSQLVPYMQVEFQLTRDPGDQLQALSQLKLLLGAVNKKDLGGANKAMVEGHQISGKQGDTKAPEVDFVGMEIFTSPQTLTNPSPNSSVGTHGTRYVDILDPFRPFATLEHVNITATPSGAGFYCYKKASLTLKIHDRSRLNEISDLIRPRVYTGVTLWMTYGWRAPNHADRNPYFSYINDNMMMREAYHIINSNFSFDTNGQVTLTLELFTKGVAEIRELKISDNSNDMSFKVGELQRLMEQVSMYRRRLHLDSASGTNKEVRPFQILDAAETGEIFDMSTDEINKKIDILKASFNKASSATKNDINGLIDTLKKISEPAAKDKKKFAFKENYKTRVTAIIQEMFNEVQTGPDPFLPGEGKNGTPELIAIINGIQKTPAAKPESGGRRSIVSFGKLFSVFALRSIMSIPETIDEVQVFFYSLNSKCGPVSEHSVAEFPIDINIFRDQFAQEVTSKGGEKMTLESFLALCINAQFLDDRAVGYGLRSYFSPYESGKEASVNKSSDKAYQIKLTEYSTKYGAFHKPVIEMFIETSHERTSQAGDSDILQSLNYSAKNVKSNMASSSKKIMRLHIYDKQTNANQAAGALLRSVDAKGNSIYITSTKDVEKVLAEGYQQPVGAGLEHVTKTTGIKIKQDLESGNISIASEFVNNKMIKDVVSKLVPTIRFGSNGSTIITANLASKADPLLSTVQMQKTMTVKNGAAPNGSGEMGLPIRVIPAQLTMTTMGNPLACMAQNYFVDFQTGTTLDNLYIVTGLTHTFSPGKFETSWNFGYSDGYGVFEGAPDIIKQVMNMIPKKETT